MNRRDFMKGILATCMAPAIVKAENIMRINPNIIVPEYPELRKFTGGIELATVPSQSVAVIYDAHREIIAMARVEQPLSFREMRERMLNGTIQKSDLTLPAFDMKAVRSGVATRMELIDKHGEAKHFPMNAFNHGSTLIMPNTHVEVDNEIRIAGMEWHVR